jgi:hypothetical protein
MEIHEIGTWSAAAVRSNTDLSVVFSAGKTG